MPTVLTTTDTDPDGLFLLNCTHTHTEFNVDFLEGKRLSCRKWENELRGQAVKDKVDVSAKLEVVPVGTQYEYMLLLLGREPNATCYMTSYEAESPNLRNHKKKNTQRGNNT